MDEDKLEQLAPGLLRLITCDICNKTYDECRCNKTDPPELDLWDYLHGAQD